MDKYSATMKNERIEILQKVANGELMPEQADEQLLGLSIISGSYNRNDMEAAFEAGGDWRMACKNLTDEVIDKIEWSENNADFEEFIDNYR